MGLGDGVESGRECEVAGRAGKEVRGYRSDLAVVCWGEKRRVDPASGLHLGKLGL